MKKKVALLALVLAFGLLLHFLKVYIPPYSVDEARMLRDAWFVNICGANIALFPFFYFCKNRYVKDYMFYIGMLSGLIALFYPQEPLAKVDQLGEFWDIVRANNQDFDLAHTRIKKKYGNKPKKRPREMKTAFFNKEYLELWEIIEKDFER